MQRYIAFLRGINLGRRRLPMSRLKALFEELGGDAVETFIASGNVVFSSSARDVSRLESQIAGHLETSRDHAKFVEHSETDSQTRAVNHQS